MDVRGVRVLVGYTVVPSSCSWSVLGPRGGRSHRDIVSSGYLGAPDTTSSPDPELTYYYSNSSRVGTGPVEM